MFFILFFFGEGRKEGKRGERSRSERECSGLREREKQVLELSFALSLSLSSERRTRRNSSQGTLTMMRAQRNASPTSNAAATRHSASVSLGSQRRAAIAATSDENAFILVAFVVVVACARRAWGFVPPARARRVETAIGGHRRGAAAAVRKTRAERAGSLGRSDGKSENFVEFSNKRRKQPERFCFHFFLPFPPSLGGLSPNASPGAYWRRRERIGRRQQVCEFHLIRNAERVPGRRSHERKSKKKTRAEFNETNFHASHFPFSLSPLPQPKNRSNSHDDSKQETLLRDGLSNVREIDKESGRERIRFFFDSALSLTILFLSSQP